MMLRLRGLKVVIIWALLLGVIIDDYWVFRFQCIILLYYLYYFLYAFICVCVFVSVCLSVCFYYIVITVFSKMGGQLR